METPSARPEAALPSKRRKLTGRAFYESLGSPKVVLAPMVDQSEFAWRLLTRSFMKPEDSKSLLAYTPMLHSRLFKETARFRDHHFEPTKKGLKEVPKCNPDEPSKDLYLDGHPTFDRPLFVQFCANSPDDLLDAAMYVQPYCDAVDLNLGCPQGIARKGNYGAFLQEDWDLIHRLISKLHNGLEIPVTAKMRILESKEKTLAYAEMILSAGASILTVHGRNRDQKGHKTGLANWSVIRYLRQELPPETVIFANGNILGYDDIQQCLDVTGADGVMSAEGNLCDPSIFAKPPELGEEGREYWRGRDGKGGYRMDAVFRRYMDILYEHVLAKDPPQRQPLFLPTDPVEESTFEDLATLPEKESEEPPRKKRREDKNASRTTSPNLVAVQAHLFHLLRPLVSKHTNIRDALAKCRAGDIPAFEKVLRQVEEATKEGLKDYESDPSKYDNIEASTTESSTADTNKEESSLATVRACKRPWWVCQPYVRPLPKEAIAKGSLTMSKKDQRRLEQDAAVKHAKTNPVKQSEREELDKLEGMPEQEMPRQSMVCG